MRYAADNVNERLLLYGGQIYSCCRLGAWCYNADRKLLHSTSPDWKELSIFLQTGGILDAAISDGCDAPEPLVYTDDIGLVWIAEPVNFPDGGAVFLICGPAFLKGHDRKELIDRLSVLDLSVALRIKASVPLERIPVLNGDMIGMFSRMLHFTIYDEILSPNYIKFADTGKEKKSGMHEHEIEEELTGASGKKRPGRMKNMRGILLNCVRNGIMAGRLKEAVSDNGNVLEYGLMDEMRTIKNNMIIFQSQCAQAAIEGGLSEEAAIERQKRAVAEIEKCTSVSRLANVNWEAFQGFVRAVHESKELMAQGISEKTRETMDYIRNHSGEPLTLSELARKAGYTEYYLSRKFAKETGMKIQDFIKQTRIGMAQVMLTSTRKSIAGIAEELQFKSRSHFDRTFTRFTGVSPARYRELRGSIPNSGEDM